MDRQIVYVSSYPKSGSTWLTRLLADTLNCPSGGSMPSEDAKEIATEGQDRPGPYIIRKGHFRLDEADFGLVVPHPHVMAYKQLENEKIIFLVRDPRDICISGAYHWRQTPEQFLDRMIAGNVARCGRWDEYVEGWLRILDDLVAIDKCCIMQYEELIKDSACYYLMIKLTNIDVNPSKNEVDAALNRQSFSTRANKLDNNEQEMKRNNMRKGIAGDWRNHFTPAMNDKMWIEFGQTMARLGYTK